MHDSTTTIHRYSRVQTFSPILSKYCASLQYNNDSEFSLTEFVDDIPPYSILSHTWGPEEVTFGDITDGN
ncbi:hypothetical protein B0O99DRAFT_622899 [Bisporella sp. PMI_857]|nr:hypothetical protein B0O99DRAFT_622899 [Bisporella sp. PMI_857]